MHEIDKTIVGIFLDNNTMLAEQILAYKLLIQPGVEFNDTHPFYRIWAEFTERYHNTKINNIPIHIYETREIRSKPCSSNPSSLWSMRIVCIISDYDWDYFINIDPSTIISADSLAVYVNEHIDEITTNDYLQTFECL